MSEALHIFAALSPFIGILVEGFFVLRADHLAGLSVARQQARLYSRLARRTDAYQNESQGLEAEWLPSARFFQIVGAFLIVVSAIRLIRLI
jgi:hypothetical protein